MNNFWKPLERRDNPDIKIKGMTQFFQNPTAKMFETFQMFVESTELYNDLFRNAAKQVTSGKDLEDFNKLDHFAMLLNIAKKDEDLAHDIATKMLYGNKGKSPLFNSYDPTKGSLVSRFYFVARMVAKEIKEKENTGIVNFSTVGMDNSSMKKIKEREPEDFQRANPIITPRMQRQAKWQDKQLGKSNEELAVKVKNIVDKSSDGVSYHYLYDLLKVPTDKLDAVLDFMSQNKQIKTATLNTKVNRGGKPTKMVYKYDQEIPEDAVHSRYREMLDRISKGQEVLDAGREMGSKTNAASYFLARKAKEWAKENGLYPELFKDKKQEEYEQILKIFADTQNLTKTAEKMGISRRKATDLIKKAREWEAMKSYSPKS